jgi:hypothetical protein
MICETEFDYCVRRAQEEAIRSIGSTCEAVADAHWRLSILHSLQAAMALATLDA